MIKQGLALAVLLFVAGCADQAPQSASSSGSQSSQTATSQGPTSAELAAYAGSHQYPQSEQAHSDIRAAALVNGDVIKIYNFGTEPIRDADIWVNRAFVRHVNAIAPGSSVSINTSNLYNAVGQQFSAKGEHVNLVQVERDHSLENLMGPANE
jgi:hypothetical protein